MRIPFRVSGTNSLNKRHRLTINYSVVVFADVQFTFRQDSYTFNESSGLVSIFVDKVGQTDLTIELMVTGRK